MIRFDLHNHSSNSRDAKDSIEDIVENAVECSLDCVGISDHNYWITGRFDRELYEIEAAAEKYSKEINVLRGMEVSFLRPDGIEPHMLEGYDYVLLEYFEQAGVEFERVCEYAQRFPCRVGIAHTDIFGYGLRHGIDAAAMLAQHNIFWELNVNYDTIHGHREHKYCRDFAENEEQRAYVRELGLQLSVGFDTHDLSDYDVRRVDNMCRLIADGGFAVPSFVKKHICDNGES